MCGRGGQGIVCAPSTGAGFNAASVVQSDYSDPLGWAAPQYYSTIAFPDVNGDGKADVCRRGGRRGVRTRSDVHRRSDLGAHRMPAMETAWGGSARTQGRLPRTIHSLPPRDVT